MGQKNRFICVCGCGVIEEWEGISFTDYFDDHTFAPLPVEFGVIDLLPCPQIEPSVCDGQQHLMMDQQIF
jgi:hypothetical protein